MFVISDSYRDKLVSIGKGAAIAAAGAVLAYALQHVSGLQLDAFTGPAVTAILAAAVQAVRKMAQDNEDASSPPAIPPATPPASTDS